MESIQHQVLRLPMWATQHLPRNLVLSYNPALFLKTDSPSSGFISDGLQNPFFSISWRLETTLGFMGFLRIEFWWIVEERAIGALPYLRYSSLNLRVESLLEPWFL